MAEHIDNRTLLDSAGHRWSWDKRDRKHKVLTATGIDGEGSVHLRNAGRSGLIAGMLKATASDRASADRALSAIEAEIEALADSGEVYQWEDDHGISGEHLKVVSYTPSPNGRVYGFGSSEITAMQDYVIEVRDQDGKR